MIRRQILTILLSCTYTLSLFVPVSLSLFLSLSLPIYIVYICIYIYIHHGGLDSSVCIATRYGLEGQMIESRWGGRFFVPVQADPVAHPASCTIGSGSFPGVKRPGFSDDRPHTSTAEVKEKVHEVTLTYMHTHTYTHSIKKPYFSPHGSTALVGQGFLIFEASRSHSDTPHSVGLLWMSDQSVAEIYTRQHATITTDIHSPGGIQTRNPNKRVAADPRLRLRGHWDRQRSLITVSFAMYDETEQEIT